MRTNLSDHGAGEVDGAQVADGVRHRRPLDGDFRSGSRIPKAGLISHPIPAGREAGLRVLLAALDAGRTAL